MPAHTFFYFLASDCVWEENKMKKLFALFVMAIFLISLVPAAFAISDTAGGQGNGQGQVVQAQTDTTAQTRDAVQARQAKAEQVKERIKNVREKYQEARERYKQNKEQVRERLANAKEKRAEAKARHEEARQKIQERKEKLQACKDSETEDCKKTRRETKMHTKGYLSNVAEHVLGLIAKTKERVEASDMPEDQKTELIAKLDEKAEEIAGAAEAVAELGEDSTREDYQEAVKLIREAWKDTKEDIKKGAGKVAANKIRALNTRMEQLQTKLRNTVQRLENAGADTIPVKAQLAEFETKLALSKTAEQEAQNKYQAGDIQGAVEKTKEAHRHLLAAHKALKQFVQNMKQVRGGEDALKARERNQERMNEGAGAQERMQERQETPVEQAEEIGETPEEGSNETA
jgi:chromosome segregation ATPase